MLKKIIIALIVIVLIVTIGVAFIQNKENVEYNNDNGVSNKNEENIVKEKFEIINQNILKENSMVSLTERIDDKYILLKITKAQEGINKENLYIYDIENNKFLEQTVEIDGDSIYSGKNKDNIYLFRHIYSENVEENKVDLIEISFPDLKINNTKDLSNIEEIRNIIVSEKSDLLAYSTEEGLYVSKKDLTNPKLLLKSNIVEENTNFESLEICVPVKFVENDTKIIYQKIGYEWYCGLGIIDIATGEDNYYERGDGYFMKYVSPDSIYTRDSYISQPITKYVPSTKKVEEILNIDDERWNIVNLSNNNDKIAFVKEIIKDEKTTMEYNVYDLNSKKIITTYSEDIINYESVIDLQFINSDKQIIIIKSNEIKIWNYDVK